MLKLFKRIQTPDIFLSKEMHYLLKFHPFKKAINFTFFSKKCHLIDFIIIVIKINFQSSMLTTWYSEASVRQTWVYMLHWLCHLILRSLAFYLNSLIFSFFIWKMETSTTSQSSSDDQMRTQIKYPVVSGLPLNYYFYMGYYSLSSYHISLSLPCVQHGA